MKKDLLNDALGQISDEFIHNAKFGEPIHTKITPIEKYFAVAACIALIVLLVPAILFIKNSTNKIPLAEGNFSSENLISDLSEDTNSQEAPSSKNEEKKPLNSDEANVVSKPAPIFKGAYYTATKLHGLFGGIVYMGGETTSYSTVDVLSSKYLYIDPLPKDEYVTVYRTTQGLPLNQNEFSLFSEKYAPKLSAALGESVPKYTFESMGHYISAEEDDHPLSMQQYKSFHAIRYWNYDLDNSGKNNMVFDGITVVIDQSKSDSQIKKSLQPLKEKLEKIFDTKFVNLDIYRYYDDYSEAGAVSVLVVFSNSDDETIKKSVKLEFDNRSHHESDIVSKNKLYKINFTYWEERGENVRDDVAVVRIKKLPLKKAEQYLSKGYVLSLQGCAICQSLQEPVDFTDYDYVEIVQRTANRENDDGTYDIIPFYAFYKYIGKGKNGNEIYAKTYVPAIEVSGWEKYFKNKHKNHNTSSQNSSSQVMSEPSVSSENTVSIVSQITSQTSSEASSAAEITQ